MFATGFPCGSITIPTTLPVPTVWARSHGEANSRTAVANSPAMRRAELKFKIANLPFPIFTEPLSSILIISRPATHQQHFAFKAQPFKIPFKRETSEVRLRYVVAGPVSHVVRRRIRGPGNSHLNPPKLRV